MNPLQPVAWLETYRTDIRTALTAAARDGFQGCDVSTLRPDFQPGQFGPSAVRHFARFTRDLGLQVEALAAAFPDRGLANPAQADQRLQHLLATLRMAADLGLRRCLVQTGGIDAEAEHSHLVQEALHVAGQAADSFGIDLAVQPTSGELSTAAESVARLSCPWLKLGIDTARFTVQPDSRLAVPVGSVHVRDARRVGDRIEETGYGEGDLDLDALLGRLAGEDYEGSLTIRRDAADAPIDALRQGREYVERSVRQWAVRSDLQSP